MTENIALKTYKVRIRIEAETRTWKTTGGLSPRVARKISFDLPTCETSAATFVIEEEAKAESLDFAVCSIVPTMITRQEAMWKPSVDMPHTAYDSETSYRTLGVEVWEGDLLRASWGEEWKTVSREQHGGKDK